MSTINQQPLADPLTLADIIAVWSSGNGDTRRASLTSLLALIQANIAFPSLNPGGQVTFLPFVGGTNAIVAQPAADVALPAAPVFGQTIEWIGTGTNTGAVTIAVTSSGGAQPVKAIQYKGAALIGGEIVAGGSAMAIYDGVAYQLVASSATAPAVPASGTAVLINGYLDWTVAGNALTLSVLHTSGVAPSVAQPVYYQVRSSTPGDGLAPLRTLTAAVTLVVPNGALLGTTSTVPFKLWGTLFNDAGVDRLGVINCVTGTNLFGLGGFDIGTSIAISAAAALSATFYTNTGVASKAYATIGYATWETGLATAGQWSANPTRKQVYGHGVPLPGEVVQRLYQQSGALQTGTTVVPRDDTIPTNAEGDQYFSQVVTPSSAANIIIHDAQLQLSCAGAGQTTAGLYQDALAPALAVSYSAPNGGNAGGALPLHHEQLAGSGAAITFKIRAGNETAGTTRLNGLTALAGRAYGGALASSYLVQEVSA